MKKLKNYLPNKILFLFIFLLIAQTTKSQVVNEKILLDEITKELRCMTCQSQTIYESESDFSQQIKNEIAEQIKKNKTKKEIIDFLVERYGEYIILKPKFDKKNLVLWLFPFLLLLVSMGIFYLKLRKNKINKRYY